MADTSVTHAHESPAYEPGASDVTNQWEGGKDPFQASYGKLMMWYFLVSDAFTFAGFLIAYGSLRFSMQSWPEPDFVFRSFPFLSGHYPLFFVTFMTFVLILSSVTMVRAVQEGHRENRQGVVFWMVLTIIGGAIFLGSQAYEWTTLIKAENMSVTTNPFGRHHADGIYLNADGSEQKNADGSVYTFKKGESYLLHKHGAGHGGEHDAAPSTEPGGVSTSPVAMETPNNPKHQGFDIPKVKYTSGPQAGLVREAEFGPKAFGALFFFITGFHGFHVFSGVVFLAIIAINSASGLYSARRNGYEMVEKIGLYWHFVDLVWVFVFLVFYLL